MRVCKIGLGNTSFIFGRKMVVGFVCFVCFVATVSNFEEVQRLLYKLVLVTYPLDHSRRIYSPSNFRFTQKTKKMKCVPITIILLP